jgi:NAD(P)-dependent dehydrogenase (short-subunit alcohol dehydrogenase family)
MSIKGKVCVVTGFTQGIGQATALELARQGARLFLVARNPERGREAMAAIARASGNHALELVVGDLALLADVRRVAAEIVAKSERIHVLVNNAGAIHQTRKVTAEGLEMTFAGNHLQYFLLTDLLLDVLEASAPARVVNVASEAHRQGTMDLDDLMFEKTRYAPMRAYGRSKLANIMFTYELARRLAARGSRVTANCLHPGVVSTGFGKNDPGWFRMVVKLAGPFFLSPEKGAQTQIYLASSPEVEGVSGKYFVRCKPARSNRASRDEAAQKRLWEISEKLVTRPGTPGT